MLFEGVWMSVASFLLSKICYLPLRVCARRARPVTSCAGHTWANRLPRQAPATFDVFDMRFEGVWMSVASFLLSKICYLPLRVRHTRSP